MGPLNLFIQYLFSDQYRRLSICVHLMPTQSPYLHAHANYWKLLGNYLATTKYTTKAGGKADACALGQNPHYGY
jgi:hypothetical protein